jgi:hypothetical protein
MGLVKNAHPLLEVLVLLGLAMRLMFAAKRTEFFHFKTLRGGPLIFGFAVIAIFALAALELNNFAWHVFLF